MQDRTAYYLGTPDLLLDRQAGGDVGLEPRGDGVDSGDGDGYVTATTQETLRHRPVLPSPA